MYLFQYSIIQIFNIQYSWYTPENNCEIYCNKWHLRTIARFTVINGNELGEEYIETSKIKKFRFRLQIFRTKTKAWLQPRRWTPSFNFVTSDKFGGNYQRLMFQHLSPAMNIKLLWYLSLKFIVQPHEFSFMSEKMQGLRMVYIFSTWNDIFVWFRNCYKKKSV